MIRYLRKENSKNNEKLESLAVYNDLIKFFLLLMELLSTCQQSFASDVIKEVGVTFP